MPVLEAMARHTPVVFTRGSSLDEVCGDANIRFEHEDPKCFNNLITDLLDHSEHTINFRVKVLSHSAGSTCEQTAPKTRIIPE